MSKIGIPADRWDWVPGKVVHDEIHWYPNMPGYGDFIDPPYEIGGQQTAPPEPSSPSRTHVSSLLRGRLIKPSVQRISE